MIGIDPGELRWIRILLALLRHPDPVVSQLTREALVYLGDSAANGADPGSHPLNHTG